MAVFNNGDVVCLKSGSLPMTIELIRTDGVIFCKWFDSEGKLCSDSFSDFMLEEYDDTPLMPLIG